MIDFEGIKNEKSKLLNIILIFTILLGISLFLINLILYSNLRPIIVLSSFSILSFITLLLNRQGFFKTAVVIIFIIALSTISINMILGNGITDPGIMALPAFTVLGSFFLGKRSIVFITLTTILLVTLVSILEITGIHEVLFPIDFRSMIIYDCILIFSGIFVYFVIRDNELYVQSIKENNDIITAQKEKLADSLEEKNILLKEIHHRIKNNMQILSSLLKLQSYNIKSIEDKKVFEDCYARINTMSLVHDKLSMSDSLKEVNFKYYFEELLHQYDDLVKNRNISIKFDVQEIEINLNQAVPVAMIINELISNSIKYAFKNKESGKITVSLKSVQDNKIKLIVNDNGIGFDETAIPQNSIGLSLIDSFSDQLKAEVNTDFNNKTEYCFIFKREK
jgi:two-component sensor histidine kinase